MSLKFDRHRKRISVSTTADADTTAPRVVSPDASETTKQQRRRSAENKGSSLSVRSARRDESSRRIETPHGGESSRGSTSGIFKKSASSSRGAGGATEDSPIGNSRNTPLHLALLEQTNASSERLMHLIHQNPKELSQTNQDGRIPLHLAVLQKHPSSVVEAIVNEYPAGISIRDRQGCTPLGYAMQIAKQKSAPYQNRHCWLSPAMDEDTLEWQQQQNDAWAIVRLLLLASASHAVTSLQIDGEQPYLLEALIHAAPPSVISLFTVASSELLGDEERGTAFACSALYLCISRQYPASILKSLARQCPSTVKSVRDETGMGLVSAQYVTGCYERNEQGGWRERQEHMRLIKHCIHRGKVATKDPHFLDWCEKIRFLVVFCHGQALPSAKYLLHATLSNSDTPPMVVKLIAAIHPESIQKADHVTGKLPLHLAVTTPSYEPRAYEMSGTKSESVIEIVLRGDPDLIRCRHDSRLPLHHAILSGKTWTAFRVLVSADRKTLYVRDPVTKLFPFQLAALPRADAFDETRLLRNARNSFSHQTWRDLSAQGKSAAVKQARRREDAEWLTTIFELVRRCPKAVKSGIPQTKVVQNARDSTGMGMVAAHFVVWCYDKKSHLPKSSHIEALQTAIQEASVERVPKPLLDDFKAWWTKMKFWIWYCHHNELGEDMLPRTDEYLLHAALSSTDTPPLIVRLLLRLYPRSVMLPVPGTDILPLHIAASTTGYTRRSFESRSTATAVSLVADLYPEAIHRRSGDRLPLNIAIDAHKTWDELEPLIDSNRLVLKCRDPSSGLFPFQQIAASRVYSTDQRLRFQYLARNSMPQVDWKQTSKRNVMLKRVQEQHRLGILGSIYELLRAQPSVLAPTLSSSSEPIRTVDVGMQVASNRPSEETNADDSIAFLVNDDEQSHSSNAASVALSAFLEGQNKSDAEHGARSILQGDAAVFSKLDVMSVLSTVNDNESAAEVKDGAKDGESRHRKASPVNDDDSTVSSSSSHLAVHRSGWSKPVQLPKKRRSRVEFKPVKETVTKCLHCGVGKRDVLLLPCRHLCLCAKCSVAASVTECPTCGKVVTDRMVVYL